MDDQAGERARLRQRDRDRERQKEGEVLVFRGEKRMDILCFVK